MALVAGTRIGPYEIAAQVGVGGMGEVYRAHDTKLKRDVALKILPESFASDLDRLARFQREAQVLASLNHPNIAHLHGLEESGGVRALVMELVEGEDLSQRIARGAIPLDEAVPIAKQIAEALEAAHEQGIIHRDLKPANIKVRDDGIVKVLDFGLAKALAPISATTQVDVSASPTITSPALMTGMGIILGTAAYMSPEQAKGRAADKRSDVWAFGCVLYEMLTGRRAFDGEDVGDTLAAVLRAEPDWTALPANLTPAIRTLLKRCLQKDRRERIADVAAVLFVLREPAVGSVLPASDSSSASSAPLPLWRRALLPAATLIAGSAVAGLGLWLTMRPEPRRVVRTTIATSGATAMVQQRLGRSVAITPDGSRIVYRGAEQLLVRALDQFEATVLDGLGAPSNPFISPDGQWIGFFDGARTIKKVAITGGLPETVWAIQGAPTGATWGPDGSIIFGTNDPTMGLQRLPATGGKPIVLTTPSRERGEGRHYWPEFLPGGDAVLFTIIPAAARIENAQIAVLDLRTGTSKVLIRGGIDAHYISTGHLVYAVPGALRAVGFDLGRLEVVGTSAPVLEGVANIAFGAADAAIAANGTLVYIPDRAGGSGRQIVVAVDRQGRASPLPGLSPDSYRDVRVSPDGSRFALATADDLWIYDVARATRSRLTTDPAPDRSPYWTRDGRRIVFTSRRAGYPELFWRPADGTGRDEKLLSRGRNLIDLQATGWAADGKQLLFWETPPSRECPIAQIAIERRSEAKVLIDNGFCSNFAAVSPNGRWIAYESTVSGQFEIYVERYPELGDRHPISTGGGRAPLWSNDGGELFFSSLDSRRMLAVPVQSGTTLIAGRPQVLFEGAIRPLLQGVHPYDITPDGRFLIIRSAEADVDVSEAQNLAVVQNWTEELKRLVPLN
jgi:hypothetical protein